MKRIINFSGGQSSAYMTILEYNRETDYVVFCDTGREHPKTYKFINDFEAFEDIPIIRLGGEGAFEKMLSKKDFKMIPNMMKRECTIEMKVRTARRWVVKNVGNKYQNLLGFRADEQERVIRNKKRWKKVDQVFPLYNLGITKAAVNNYWLQKPYRLEIPSILGNCTLCFMKGTANVINILRHDPSLAAPWIADEEKSKKHYGHTYLKGITIAECLRIASMPDLFTEKDLDQLLPSYNCSCSS